MTTQSSRQKKTVVAAGVFILLVAMALFCGCTTQPSGTPAETPTKTAVPTTTVPATTAPANGTTLQVYTETANGTTAMLPLGAGLIVKLIENPSTGFSWNASVTPGLAIVSDAYEPGAQSQGMVGAPGTHSWTLTTTAEGAQKFTAVYKRPWENVTGSEDTFVLDVLVQKA